MRHPWLPNRKALRRQTVRPGRHRARPSGTAGRLPGTIERKVTDMAIGPVQLIVLGFRQPDFHGEIIAELERLRAAGTVRVIDSLVVYKDKNGELEVEHLSNLSQAEAIELGSKVGALIGLGIDGEDGMSAGALAGAEAAAGGIPVFSDRDEQARGVLGDAPNHSAGALAGAEAAADGIHVFPDDDEQAWDVLGDVPNDSAAALILLEHHWAVPLRDAVARAGGFRIGDGFISPLDLVDIGLVSADEARELHAMETSAVS